jgi:hypothetical protein
MSRLLLALLAVTLLSPVLWTGLLTRVSVLKLIGLGLASVLWLWWMRRRGGDDNRALARHASTLVTVAAAAVIWLDGTLLTLLTPEAGAWQAIPILLLGLLGLLSLVPGRPHPLPWPALATLWGGLALAILIGVLGDPRLAPHTLLATVPVILMPWSLPRCLARVSADRQHALQRLSIATLVIMVAGGLLQARSVRREFETLLNADAPWTGNWTAAAIAPLALRNARFPQPGGEALITTLRGLAAIRAGDAQDGARRLGEAVTLGENQPASVSALCWAWGRQGALGALGAKVTPRMVIDAESLEAARFYLGALIADDDFGRAQLIHTHFGDALFITNHPVLTPQRIGAALTAWGRPAEAMRWFTLDPGARSLSAESEFWRGLAEEAQGRQVAARQAWETAVLIAPGHADARSHLDGTATRIRAEPDLLAHPVAGRQLVGVTVTQSSPEETSGALTLRPGQRLRVECRWRIAHESLEPAEIRLRLGDHETVIMHLGATTSLLTGDNALHIGERETTSGDLRIPETLAATTDQAQLVVSTAPGTATPFAQAMDLAPLAASPGFRPLGRRNTTLGISAATRLRLFPDGRPLEHSVTLRGSDAAMMELPEALSAREVGMVSFLAGGSIVPDRGVVAELFISDQNGHHWVFPILAGVHTSDTWRDYPPAQDEMRHGWAPIAWQTPRELGGHQFHNTRFVGRFDLGEEREIRAVKVRPLLPPGVELHIVDMVFTPGEKD